MTAPDRHAGPYAIDCPACAAGPDEPCINPRTGQPYRSSAPHIERLRAARKAGR